MVLYCGLSEIKLKIITLHLDHSFLLSRLFYLLHSLKLLILLLLVLLRVDRGLHLLENRLFLWVGLVLVRHVPWQIFGPHVLIPVHEVILKSRISGH